MNMKKLVVASHNAGKIREIKSMLEPFRVEVVSAAELDLPDVEETGLTFEENARLKSEALAKESGCYALGDDSGLCVNCLSGRPGVYSARYAPNRDFDKGMDMLLEEISESGAKDRSAYFACVLALTSPAGETRIFEGRVNGRIALENQAATVLVMIRFLFPTGLIRRLPILIKRKRTGYRIAAGLFKR